ncbi:MULTISPECIES: transporter [unclassified Paraburkholderia]|uniref:SphA family protein n=1 Tax=unclassified Paraburkholderia TaxID=2615204 RepID=UPI002AB302ED|nr:MULTISPECIES: transporter [unclassified Paraburkholderia]
MTTIQARRMSTRLLAAIACSGTLGVSLNAAATESGIGRPITGMQISPYAGVVPPTSDWIISLNTIYYEGSVGASKTLPIAGRVTAGLDYTISYTLINAVKTWRITAGGWNFGTSFGVPLQYTDISLFHGVLPNDHGTQFADVFFSPVVAGYHLTKIDHIALSVQIFAPTGAYNANRLANAGQNTWTFTPTIAYTHIFPAENIEFSLNYGLEFYTPNNDTQYHNAPVSVLDVLALKRFAGGWGAGIIGGYIQQVGNDTGGIIQLTGGSQGHSVGIGPTLTWNGKIDKTLVGAALRWVNEFSASNRPKGNAVELTINATFQ